LSLLAMPLSAADGGARRSGAAGLPGGSANERVPLRLRSASRAPLQAISP
jgi:hypothetical protein